MANILLVDDRPENLLALEGILEPLGQNLVVAHSGEDALRQLLRHEVAVILLDVQHGSLDPQVQDRRQPAGWRGDVAMLRDDHRQVDLRRQIGHQPPDRVEPAPRSPDADQLVHSYATFLYRRSLGSSSSNASSWGLNRIDSFAPSASTPNVTRLS